ncbi:hypothetical protein RRG08_062186 [Elysia crispata]|uniref:Uncharacterized protein n=1 Tax=Elysia crispata TaxID=231223 RepID=A0AAE0YBW5_9GAST|nr:hypothetical protein RRG08_062186 [Elysia crispata]
MISSPSFQPASPSSLHPPSLSPSMFTPTISTSAKSPLPAAASSPTVPTSVSITTSQLPPPISLIFHTFTNTLDISDTTSSSHSIDIANIILVSLSRGAVGVCDSTFQFRHVPGGGCCQRFRFWQQCLDFRSSLDPSHAHIQCLMEVSRSWIMNHSLLYVIKIVV